MDSRFLIDRINSFLPALDHLPDNQAIRLFHGRGHCYPGYEHMCIDWYNRVILITLYREEEPQQLENLSCALRQRFSNCQTVLVQNRHKQKAPIVKLWGEDRYELNAFEQGLGYKIIFGQAQNHGIFLDMQKGRDWVREHSNNKKVLNLFAYTCAFSVAAVAGGAQQVVNVDLSKASLSRGRENHRLNNQDTGKVKFEGVNIFKSYSRLKKHGPYQLLICDPPSFQKGSVDIKRDYQKILRRIPELMSPGAQLMLCLNSPDLDQQFLQAEVERECPDCQLTKTISPPPVFCEAFDGKGLKTLIYKYLPQA